MDLPDVKAWVRDMSESEVNGTTLAGASYYAPGFFCQIFLWHCCTGPLSRSTFSREIRSICFLLHNLLLSANRRLYDAAHRQGW
jgi:hypothetical protein